MFNLGFGEMLLLAAIALIVLGPKELPKMAKMLGKTIAEFKRAMREVTTTMTSDISEERRPPREAKKIAEIESKDKEENPNG